MTLKLYQFPHSTCSQKVRLVLWEKELPFEIQNVDHKSREQTSDWYLKLNPNGVVPTLEHDGNIIVDSSVIIEYLDEVLPNKPLTPSNPVKRAQMRKWMRYFEEVPTPAIRVPSFNKYLRTKLKTLSDEDYLAIAEKHPIRKQFYLKMDKASGFDARESAGANENLRQTIERVEQSLAGHGGPWIMGEELTLADYTLVPTIDRMNDLGLAEIGKPYSQAMAWFDRIKQRPAFAKTYHENTRLSEIFP